MSNGDIKHRVREGSGVISSEVHFSTTMLLPFPENSFPKRPPQLPPGSPELAPRSYASVADAAKPTEAEQALLLTAPALLSQFPHSCPETPLPDVLRSFTQVSRLCVSAWPAGKKATCHRRRTPCRASHTCCFMSPWL